MLATRFLRRKRLRPRFSSARPAVTTRRVDLRPSRPRRQQIGIFSRSFQREQARGAWMSNFVEQSRSKGGGGISPCSTRAQHSKATEGHRNGQFDWVGEYFHEFATPCTASSPTKVERLWATPRRAFRETQQGNDVGRYPKAGELSQGLQTGARSKEQTTDRAERSSTGIPVRRSGRGALIDMKCTPGHRRRPQDHRADGLNAFENKALTAGLAVDLIPPRYRPYSATLSYGEYRGYYAYLWPRCSRAAASGNDNGGLTAPTATIPATV